MRKRYKLPKTGFVILSECSRSIEESEKYIYGVFFSKRKAERLFEDIKNRELNTYWKDYESNSDLEIDYVRGEKFYISDQITGAYFSLMMGECPLDDEQVEDENENFLSNNN